MIHSNAKEVNNAKGVSNKGYIEICVQALNKSKGPASVLLLQISDIRSLLSNIDGSYAICIAYMSRDTLSQRKSLELQSPRILTDEG